MREEITVDERQEVKSLKKALRALEFLNSHGESTVTKVASAIKVPRTTSYRLLETLAAAGYLEKQSHSDFYRLTSQVQRLSSGFGDTDLLGEVAKPLVRRVGEEIGWPLTLATPRNLDMIVRVTTNFDTSLAIDRYAIGFGVPILVASAGLCYLAACDEETRASVIELAAASGRWDDVLRNDGEDLAYRLDQIRIRGFCNLVLAEYREAGLAVPLVVGGRSVGGIVMRYMKSTQRMSEVEGRFVPILKKLAEDIVQSCEARIDRRKMLDLSSPALRPAPSGLASLNEVVAAQQIGC